MPLSPGLYIQRQTTGLWPEEKAVTGRKLEMLHRFSSPCTGTDEPPSSTISLNVGVKTRPYRDIHMGPVVQTSPFQMFIIDTESQGFNEMQTSTCTRTQTCNITRVRRNFRMIKNDVQHGKIQKWP